MKRSESNGPASSTSESIEYVPSPETDGIRRHQFIVEECVRHDFHFGVDYTVSKIVEHVCEKIEKY